MIIHVASVAVLFVNPVSQAQNVLQCAPTAPEPWWKTLVQVLLSTIPVVGGVWIALWSFHATSKKEGEHWMRDQKMAEWKGLIQAVAELEEIMPLGEVGSSAVDGIRYKVLPLCNRISHVISQALFVVRVLSDHGVQPEIYQLMRDTDSAIGRTEAFPQSSQADKMALGTPVQNAIAIRKRLQALHAKLVSLARSDLSLD